MQWTLHLVWCSFQADTLNCQQESGNSCGLWEGFWDILGPAIIEIFFPAEFKVNFPNLENCRLVSPPQGRGFAADSNWQPVSLLNTDDKIMFKVLKMHPKKKKRVISRLIVNAQTFRIPERYVYDLIFLVRLNYFWSNCISSFWVAIPKSGKNHFTVCIIPSHMELIPKQDLQKI